MGVAGFICPGDGQAYDTETYLEMARQGELFERGIPFHFAALKTMAFERDVKGVSATELLGCSRRWFLQREFPYYIRPENHWRLYRGTSIHTAIEVQVGDTQTPCERCGGTGTYTYPVYGMDIPDTEPCDDCGGTGVNDEFVSETRYYRTFALDGESVTLSGQVDNYWPYKGVIADHKDKNYAAVKGPADERHILQMSIYAWIIDGDESNDYPTPTRGGIYYQDGKRPILKTFDLLPLGYVEGFVKTRLREFRGMGHGTYPEPLRDPDDVKIMCGSCAVREHCERLAREGK